MEDKNPNQNPNPITGNTPQTPPATPVNNTPPVENPTMPSTNPPTPPTPSPSGNIPTPPAKSNGGKGSAIIVGGILFIFIIIVVALYFLIIKQAAEPETQIPAPSPVEQTEPTQDIDPTPANAEEQDVINIDIEDDLDEEFTPIDEDLNQL